MKQTYQKLCSATLSASSTQHMWELVAGNRTAHGMRWEGGSALIADRCACKFGLVFESVTCFYCC